MIEWFFGQFAFFSITLQKMTAATVLAMVATMPGPTTAAGFPLPYWLRYAIMFTGISCNEDIFKIKKVHISFDATPSPLFFFPF